MKLLDWLERRLSRFAIPNLTLMLIIGQVVIFMIISPQLMAGETPPLLENIMLIPSKVLGGEVWRVFTYLIVPPETNMLFAFFTWYLFYLMGTALEGTWGTFRFNVFILVGFIASVAASFLVPDVPASSYYLYGSVFLAFARFFPDFIINIFFVLPIKIKWLALLAWLNYGLSFASGSGIDRVLIVAALANYLLFFWRDHIFQIKDHRRRLDFATKINATSGTNRMVHACAVCGLSSDDEPRTAFRYCSQCDGQHCYCPAHIRDHEHVTERPAVE